MTIRRDPHPDVAEIGRTTRERFGLVRREKNPADGCSQHLVLTDRGRKLARAAAEAAVPMEQALLARLTRAEHAMLIELLDKLAPA